MSIERSYIWFSGLIHFALGISATAYIPFQKFIGLSNAEIFLVEVVFSLTLLLCEIPTGMLADKRGRVWSLTIGASLWAFSTAMVGAAGGFWSVLPSFIGIGISNAFLTGATEAWLKDALHAEGRDDRFHVALSRSATWGGVAMWVGGLAGAASFLLHPRLQWPLAAIAIAVAFIVVRVCMKGKGEAVERVTEWEALRKGWGVLRKSSALKWAMAATVLFPFFWVVQLQWSPVVFERDGFVPLLIAWTVASLGFSVGAYVTRFVEQGSVRFMIGALSMIAVVLLLLPVAGLWLTPILLFGWRFSRGLFEPSMTTFVQSRIESSYRATYGSLQSFVGRAATILVFLLMSARSFEKTFDRAFRDVCVTGGVVLLCGIVLLVIFRPRVSRVTA